MINPRSSVGWFFSVFVSCWKKLFFIFFLFCTLGDSLWSCGKLLRKIDGGCILRVVVTPAEGKRRERIALSQNRQKRPISKEYATSSRTDHEVLHLLYSRCKGFHSPLHQQRFLLQRSMCCFSP